MEICDQGMEDVHIGGDQVEQDDNLIIPGEEADLTESDHHEFDNEDQEKLSEIEEHENEIDDDRNTVPCHTRSLVIVDASPEDDRSDPAHVSSGTAPGIPAEMACALSHEDALAQEQGELMLRLNDTEGHCSELEARLSQFEEKLDDLQKRMKENLDSKEDQILSMNNDLELRADASEFRELKKDFEHFSKRLRRVVQAEDSVNAESLDATKVPPDVLEITYAKTLNDLYGAMLGIYGDREAMDMVENVRESVREFSAGIDFFRFENESFVVSGLSEAISSKIISVKQIHGTYVELFKMLFQYVPNYNSQDFRAFVETGSREYTIEKVVSHEESLGEIISDINVFRAELANITENVTFMAELQNNQLEEAASHCQEFQDMKEQMKGIARAVNLHTKAMKKLNSAIRELQLSAEVNNEVPVNVEQKNDANETHEGGSITAHDLQRIEEMVLSRTVGREEVEGLIVSRTVSKEDIENVVLSKAVSKEDIEDLVLSKAASKDEIMVISDEIESFKSNVESILSSIQQQLRETISDQREITGNGNDLSGWPVYPADSDPIDSVPTGKLSDMPIEDVITGQLSELGSATLKQLEKHITENGYSIDHEKLSLVISYLEQEQLVSSAKKGRYTFYSVTDLRNV